MIRKWAVAAFDRGTSVAVGFALAFIARTFHVVIDPQSQLGYQVLAVGLLTALYDLAARWAAKRYGRKFPWLSGILGVTVKVIVLALIASVAFAVPAVNQAQAATDYFCDEYSGNQFWMIDTGSPVSSRISSQTVRIYLQSDLPVSMKFYADGEYQGYAVMNAHPVDHFGYGSVASYDLHAVLPHTWSIGTTAINGNSWHSSYGYGNHCADAIYIA